MSAGPLLCLEVLHAAVVPQKGKEIPAEKRAVRIEALSGTGNIKSTVYFTAKDSIIYNLDRRTMDLWGKARIDHDGANVKAPKIVIDLDTSLLYASGTADSSGVSAEPAVFTDRQGSFDAEMMTYSFKTKRGETTNVSSTSREIIFSGEHVTRNADGELIITNGTFTTCDDEEPHYWFSSSHMNIIPDNRIIARPLVMHIRPELFSKRLPAIPILALPYMVFPIKEGRSSGFLIPSLSSDDRGYYLSNLGYFWAINDYMDLRLEGDLAFDGSWRLGERFRYTKINSFTGELSGEYRRNPQATDWNAKVRHTQVFDPSMRLDANLKFQGGDRYYDLNSMNSETIVTEQSNAYASLAKTFNDENSIAALVYNRSADLRNHNSMQTVRATFYQNRMYPFRSGFSEDTGDWKSDFSVTAGASYSGQTLSVLDASSSGYAANANVELGYFKEFAPGYKALFTQGFSLQGRRPVSGIYNDDPYSGTRLVLPLRMQSTLFHHFNINPSLTYIQSLQTDGEQKAFSTAVFAVDATTRLYGTLETGALENLLGLKALRHTFIPSLTYAWNPSFSTGAADAYRNRYDWTDYQLYNRYENTTYTGLPEGQSTVGITLKNLFHGRFRGPSAQGEYSSPAGDHSVELLSLTASTAYNFAADALHLAPLTLTASSNALSQNLLFNAGSMYDFYSYDASTGERVNRLNSEDGRGVLRFVKGFLDMSYSFQGRRNQASSSSTSSATRLPNATQALFRDRFNKTDFSDIDYGLPWQFRISLFLHADRSNPLKPLETTSLLSAAATVPLSKNWQAAVNTGYDLRRNKLAFPMLQLYRDLHCWQLSFQWVPVGEFQSYAVQIGLKASQLTDLKLRQTGRSPGIF